MLAPMLPAPHPPNLAGVRPLWSQGMYARLGCVRTRKTFPCQSRQSLKSKQFFFGLSAFSLHPIFG